MSACCDGGGESRAGTRGLAWGMAAVKKPTEAEEPEGAGKTQSAGMEPSPGLQLHGRLKKSQKEGSPAVSRGLRGGEDTCPL